MDMVWTDGKIEKVTVRSELGGNLRMRVPNAMSTKECALTPAKGDNSNPFYFVEETPAPVISDKANLEKPNLNEGYSYDLATEAGKTYILMMN